MAHTFNGSTKRITIDPNLSDVDVKELYSEWKEWALQGDNLQYLQAMRTFGGDPTVEGQTAPAYYFLMNGWRCVVDGFDAVFAYNLYTDEGENPVITLNGGTALLNNSDVGIAKTSLDKSLDYSGYVYVDFINGEAGTEHPYGTAGQPVDTFSDAITIANDYNLHRIFILEGTATVTNEDLSRMSIAGTSPLSCGITLSNNADASYDKTNFRDLTVDGACADGALQLERCNIGDLDNFQGYAIECGLGGEVTIAANGQATFWQCASSIPGSSSPVLNMNSGNPTSVSVRAYSGGLRVTNADTPNDTATIEYVAGKCFIDDTNTDGYISVRGVVHLTDESTGTTVDTTAMVGNLIDLSDVTINTGDITVDIDNAAIATATRVELDSNSTKLAEIKTQVDKGLTKTEFLGLK